MEIVFRQNPWWFFEDWERRDRSLRMFRQSRVRWVPRWIDSLSLRPFSLNFVYGVRQTGKTTGVKLLIKRLLEKGVRPERVFYFDLESISGLRELRQLLLWYFDWRRSNNVEGSFIFLDEASSVPEWWRVVKFFIDQGYFEGDVITVLGSSTIGILKSPERFPGRRGMGTTVEVLPLSFPEFVEVHGLSLREALYSHEELRALWDKYKRTGGFPTAINESETAVEDLIAGITSEIYRHGKSLEIAKGILRSLLEKIPSPLSYHSIAQDVGVSHRTVREYLEFLRDSMVLGIAYLRSDRVYLRREKKVFFRDPFILRTASVWTMTGFLDSALYEGIVQEHLLRKYGSVFYYRNSHEVDCVANDLRVEVKAGKPHRRHPRNVVILDEDSIPRFLIEIHTNPHF